MTRTAGRRYQESDRRYHRSGASHVRRGWDQPGDGERIERGGSFAACDGLQFLPNTIRHSGVPRRAIFWISIFGGLPHPLTPPFNMDPVDSCFALSLSGKVQSPNRVVPLTVLLTVSFVTFVTFVTFSRIDTGLSAVEPASSEIFPSKQEPSCFSVEGKTEADRNHSCGRTNAAPSALRRSHGILHPSLPLPNP